MKKLMFLFLASFLIQSCIDQKFDEPPAEGNTSGLVANKTIKELKAFHTSGAFDKITEDWIIEGVVVADDQSGNYYKTIVIQDNTAGIDLKIDANSIYNDYPVGRKIYIKCNGLTISDYNGLIQLGGGTFKNNSGQDQLAGIEQLLVASYIVKGEKDVKITPKEVKLGELNDDYVSSLVVLKDVQFDDAAVGQTYADAVKKLTLNKNIIDCDAISIVLRTSGYASFANEKIPNGKGTITGIYSVFGTTRQFYIRDITDVNLNDTRCGGGGGTGNTLIPIGDLRTAFANGTTTAPADSKIAGIVISDKASKNIANGSVVIQGADGKGITVRTSASYALGDAIEVVTSNAVMSEYNGLLQIAATTSVKTGTGTITPKVVTLAQLNTDFEALESTLVTIENATTTSTVFGFNVNLTDASGKSAVYYTGTSATFSGAALPGNVINATGIVSQFNTTKQIQPRNTSDATKGSGGGTGGTLTQKSIAEIRSVFTGTKTKAPDNTFIKGIVISDKDGKNINSQNLILQEPNGKGILVRFSTAHTFALGDEIEVNISGIELSEFNSLLQVNGVPIANGKKTGTGSITPKELTVNQLTSDFENYESTLVVIKNATIPTAAKYAGTIKINDGTGEIDLFTATGAAFANNVPPVGAKTITAIVTQFKATGATTTGYQVQIRNESDIK